MLLQSMIKLLLKKPSKHIFQLFDDKIGFKKPSLHVLGQDECYNCWVHDLKKPLEYEKQNKR